jgi:hypothetical protein
MAIAAGGTQARRTFATSVSPEKSPGRGAEIHVIGWLWECSPVSGMGGARAFP